MHITNAAEPSIMALLQAQFRVIVALMLRDMRTRFFGHGLGFLVAIAWPLAHILILIGIFTLLGRSAPYGESMTVFFASGLVPFITFLYISRFTMLSLVFNRPLLAFPAIKVVDIVVARTLLESLGACCTVIFLLVIFALFGIDFRPPNVVEAACALGASVLLGAGLGMLNGILALATPLWMTGYMLLTVAMYATSGILFVPSALPETVRYYFSFLPALQLVEWMRSAYYEDYSTVLDKPYVIWWGVVTVLLGLVIERLVRGLLLIAR